MMIPYEDVAGPEEDEDEHERHGYDVHKQTTILHNRNISLWCFLCPEKEDMLTRGESR